MGVPSGNVLDLSWQTYPISICLYVSSSQIQEVTATECFDSHLMPPFS